MSRDIGRLPAAFVAALANRCYNAVTRSEDDLVFNRFLFPACWAIGFENHALFFPSYIYNVTCPGWIVK